MSKKIKRIILIFILILLIAILSVIISYKTFKIYNPFVPLKGIFEIVTVKEDYVQICEYPKVIVANKNTSLKDYMTELGYSETNTELSDKFIHEFTLAEHQEYVEEIIKKHYAIWIWR